ncbi:MAG: recombinase [Gammaproteobacteria bacterium]|nr:recombinase [Gammaproteobacteria bacterium]
MKQHPHHSHPDPDHTPDGHYVGPDFEGALEAHPLWQRDNVTLSSVCVDIGSAGTQVLFSRVRLRRQAVDLSSRFLTVARETLFESPIHLTPYSDEKLIDAKALGGLVDEAYRAARLHPDEIDTGIVILTGEALRRENAEQIADVLARTCGELVCASAGHHMEGLLAAHGSGAVQTSHERAEKILNIDIGGGTTKLSVIERGNVVSTAALHIGARLVAVDLDGTIVRLDPAGRAHAERAGFAWSIGADTTPEQIKAVAASMADDLVAALSAPSPEVMALYLTEPIGRLEGIDSVIFSGGVSEYVYGREDREFGDLGRALGKALRQRVESGELPWRLLPDSRGIRSTALGGSEFTAQMSGNTVYLSNPDSLLPRRNLQVIAVDHAFAETIDSDSLAQAIERGLERFDVDVGRADVVLALHWDGRPEYERIKALADGIRKGLAARIGAGRPIYVVLDADIAMNLGAVLREDTPGDSEVLVIDGLTLWDFDYIDLGRLRLPSGTVPVTIKSLVFADTAEGARQPQRIQCHE